MNQPSAEETRSNFKYGIEERITNLSDSQPATATTTIIFMAQETFMNSTMKSRNQLG